MSTKFTDDEWLLIFQQRTQSGLSVRLCVPILQPEKELSQSPAFTEESP